MIRSAINGSGESRRTAVSCVRDSNRAGAVLPETTSARGGGRRAAPDRPARARRRYRANRDASWRAGAPSRDVWSLATSFLEPPQRARRALHGRFARQHACSRRLLGSDRGIRSTGATRRVAPSAESSASRVMVSSPSPAPRSRAAPLSRARKPQPRSRPSASRAMPGSYRAASQFRPGASLLLPLAGPTATFATDALPAGPAPIHARQCLHPRA
jgi:hypothetical protein